MSILGCSSPATYCQPAVAAGFIYCKSQEWDLHSPHSPSPAGFVYLEFSWMHAPFVFSSRQPYQPVAIVVLSYLEFTWVGAPLLLSHVVCHTLAAVRRLLLSKHTGEGGTTPMGECPFSSLQWSFPQDRHCYKLSLLKGCWAGATTPAFSGWLVYLQFTWGSAPPSPWSSGCPALFVACLCFFFSPACLLFSFWVFFLEEGPVCPWGYAVLSQGVPHATYLLTWWSPKQGRS
jgi:hypothetical protein